MQIVVYIRSTKTRPPASQRPVVNEFTTRNRMTVAEELVERSGAKGYPKLKAAIEAAGDRLLVISNLGKLARSVEFTTILKDCPNFVALEDPNFNSNTIGIMLNLAEEHSRTTSESLKASDKQVGGHQAGIDAILANNGAKDAAKARSKKAKEFYATKIMPRIRELREQDELGYKLIARVLNSEGHVTQAGKPFTEVAVLRLIKRYAKDLPTFKTGRRPGWSPASAPVTK